MGAGEDASNSGSGAMTKSTYGPADASGVWVYLEHEQGRMESVSLELLQQGRVLADALQTTLTGILEWPQRAEGRVRQFNGTALIERGRSPAFHTLVAARAGFGCRSA